MERMNVSMAAVSCRGEEIIVRWRPGMVVGRGAPMRAAVWAAPAAESWGSLTPDITRLGTAAERSWLNSAVVMAGIPCRLVEGTGDSKTRRCTGRRPGWAPAPGSGAQAGPH